MKFCAPLSVKNRNWQLRPPVPDAGSHPMFPIAAQIAAARGVADIPAFFNPSFKSAMPDPHALKDMERAIKRIADAIEAGQIVGIIGDYDVDGATSTSLLVRLFRMLDHGKVAWRIPHRMTDGYGPNDRLIDDLCDKDGIEVLMIVDSGTAAIGPVSHARARGLDVVILDHHDAHHELPDAILVNPKRPDEDRRFDYLCTVGLGFLFAVGLMRELKLRGRFASALAPDVRDLLGLVALGTIADVVPLVGLNRAYVALGLSKIPAIPGLAALIEVTGDNPSAHACGFVYGPCINAAGRLEDMSKGAELLMSDDPARVAAIAKELHELNQVRRAIQQTAVDQAKARLGEPGPDEVNRSIVLYDKSWHPGVVGLIAAKVREAYDRPTIAIGEAGKGSCRSVDGFNIGHAIIEATAKGILEKGGGHAAAAGLTVNPTRIAELAAHVDAAMVGFERPATPVDLVVACGDLKPALGYELESLAPFGQGNAKARIAVTGGFVRSTQILKGRHVKAILSGKRGDTTVLAFNAVDTPIGQALIDGQERYIDVLGTLEMSQYAGRDQVTLKPEDIMIGVDLEASVAA